MKRLFVTLILLALITTGTAYAQVTSVSLDVSPENADIGDIITITASSYSEDLARANFTWTANNKVIKTGIGASVISFKKLASMPLVTIGVTINLPGGDTIQQSVDITNQSLDLIWEAIDSYTPPFYKGKALPIQESSVRFSPIASRGSSFGSNGNKNNIYTWSRANEVVSTVSGTGKDSYPIVMDYLSDQEQIGVRVEGIKNNSIQTTDLTLKPFDPKILLYKKNNTGGILWNKTVNEPINSENPTTIFASPYFITPKNLKNVDVTWTQDNNTIANGSYLTIGPSTSKSSIEITAENVKTFFQEIKKTVILN